MTVHSVFEQLEDRRLMSSTISASMPTVGGPVVLAALGTPSVSGVVPGDGTIGISTLVAVKADVNLPNVGAGVSDASVRASGNVTLMRVSDNVVIPANVNTTGGGDAIVLTPTAPLDPNTKYKFTVTSNVKDTSGASFAPFSSTFTTGAVTAAADPSIRFNKTALPITQGYQWTSLTVGPDGRLYAGTRTGQIVRFDLNPDGTISGSKTIQTVRTGNNGNERLITGITFDPKSTKTKPILWVVHGINLLEGAANWSGKISKLTGKNLEIYNEVIYNLPRSGRDHLTNQPSFGPDGLLYVAVGSQSAMGAPDSQWGLRNETMLSAAILQINTAAISTPLNVKTTDAGGTYNPRKAGAPVRLYATGVRNAYDLIWTSEGKLFAPTNGSAKGGNAPAGGGAPGLTNLPTQNDPLYDIVEGGYYGHPNPARGEFVLNGGNPTSGKDANEVTQYPVGTQPLSNYKGVAYDFGRNVSPDGVIEFSGGVFKGKLNHALIVAQYSAGDNLIVLTRNANGSIDKAEVGYAGTTGFIDPLDLVQHPTSGYIYVAEYGASRITLLTPDQSKLISGRRMRTDKDKLVFNDVKGGSGSATQTLTIRNRGTRGLTIGSLSFVGASASMFTLVEAPNRPFDLGPGQYVTIKVNFTAPSGTTSGVKSASLRIVSNDTGGLTTVDIPTNGIATPGLEGANEPSFQRILDAYGYRDNVGDDDKAEANIPLPPLAGNDEITAQAFVKAGTGNVTVDPIAVFAPDFTTFVAGVGYYPTASNVNTQVFTVNKGSNQTVDARYTGWNQFDPGSAAFGFYTLWPQRNNRITYSDDGKNTWDDSSANGRKMRVYPLKNADGSIEPNAYLLGVEAIPSPVDHQDIVLLVRNVQPVAAKGARAQSASASRVSTGAVPATGQPPRIFGEVLVDPDEQLRLV